jgi:hypothetical protein
MNGLRERREIPRKTFSSIPADTGHPLLAAIISFVNPSVSLLVYLIIPFVNYFVVVNESGRMSTRRSPIIRYFTARLTINYFYQHNAVCISGGDKKTNDYRKCIRSWRHVSTGAES